MDRLQVDDVVIEYEVRGKGESVLLIHPSLVADGLALPLFGQPKLADQYQLIHYHRRGWMGSTRGMAPLTFERGAADAAALLKQLQIGRAHVVGHSFGGNIALQLAVDAPELVHSLALLETPLWAVPSGRVNYEQTMLPMLNAYRSGEKEKSVLIFCDAVFGPNWQFIVEQTVPGGVQQAVHDVDTFIQELGSTQQWPFGTEQAAGIKQPVLSVVGTRSKPFMIEGRGLLHSWFPQTEDCDVPTTHLLQMQDPRGVTEALGEFFSRHPMG